MIDENDEEVQDPGKDIPMGKESVAGCNHKQFSGQVKALQHLGENYAQFIYLRYSFSLFCNLLLPVTGFSKLMLEAINGKYVWDEEVQKYFQLVLMEFIEE